MKKISVQYTEPPGKTKILKALGETIRDKRKIRMITTTVLCSQCDISRTTLRLIENGNPGVSMGRYLDIMIHLGMGWDLFSVAVDDPLSRIYQNGHLGIRSRYAQMSTDDTDS